MKKWALLLALLMLVLIPVSKPAAAVDSGDWTYELLDDGSAEITKYNGTDADVTVPDSLDGHTVTGIGEKAFYECENLTSVSLPESLTSIDESAFNRTGLTSIVIPGSFKTLDTKAFSYLDSLQSVVISEGVESIGEWAFAGCSNLTSVTLPNSLTSIGNAAFGLTRLTEIEIPEGVTSIGDYAFYGCDNLKTVTFPESLTAVGANPFEDCPNLETIEVSADHPVFEVVDGALINKDEHSLIAYPAGLTAASYTVPEGVTTIGIQAFYYCPNLTNVTLPESLTSIGDSAFSVTGLTEIEIPEGVTTIGSRAFISCGNLTSATLPESLTSIGDSAFRNTGLTEIVIPEGVTTIGEKAFYECENLTSVTLPSALTSIGEDAFRGTGLTEIVIPEGVTTIGEKAFYECENLTSVSLPESLTSIDEHAFDGTALTSVNVVPGSYAETWAKENGLECVYSETTETIILTETLTVPQMIEPTATWTYHEAGSAEIFILYYYDIANGIEDDPYYQWESDAYVPSIEFEQQVRMLYELGYTSITLSQMVDVLRNGGELPERPVIFTFDSTELGQWKNAYPILKKYGFVGNLMIRANHVDAHNSLSKEQIDTMMDDGWEIGSAGYYGNDLADLSVIEQEIGRSKPALEEMFDVDIEVFAYQDGYTDSEGRIISRTVQSGYLAALAGDLRSTEIKLSKNMYYIPRYLIRKGVTYNEFLDMLPWKEGTISRETMEWTTLAP